MATALRELVTAAFAAQLDAALSGVTVERDRSRDVSSYPMVVVLDGDLAIVTDNHGFDDVRLAINCEVYVTAATEALVGAAWNDMQARVVAVITADRTLGGLAIEDVEQVGEDGVAVAQGEGHGPLKSGMIEFEVHYLRVVGDPYTFGP